MKRIRGKLFYFGTWAKRVDGKLVRIPGDGRDEALAEFEKKKEAKVGVGIGSRESDLAIVRSS